VTVLEIRDVSHEYRKPALHGVSFSIEPGDFVQVGLILRDARALCGDNLYRAMPRRLALRNDDGLGEADKVFTLVEEAQATKPFNLLKMSVGDSARWDVLQRLPPEVGACALMSAVYATRLRKFGLGPVYRSIAAGDAPAIAFDLGEPVQFVECSLLVSQCCCTGPQKRAYWSGAGHRLRSRSFHPWPDQIRLEDAQCS